MWTGSKSPNVTGYNVYRTFSSGNGYVLLNAHPVNTVSYLDATVSSGQTYYYALTAVDAHKNESAYCKEIQMSIP